MALKWRLREVMAVREIKSAAELHRRLSMQTGSTNGPSQAQVYRLVEDGPERLNIATLDILCTTLDVSPTELLTDDRVGIPTRPHPAQ